ncbi:MAG: aspartyl/asparaginyl beta-hydroxylase domain-containing protein [Gammaproteobacteria bacterium]|nr:aspartyl/asparaginyl beta-hydroxylase domain-containing protein [Gammaproteobacteria bacterium]NND54126.1 aspartyl/asparaginyl beta-hydroxylase domain-containing protein [Gammaproteobacteria bacterium]
MIRKTIRKLQMAAYRDPSLSADMGPLGHSYPWQLYTRLNGIQLTAQLDGSYPVEPLQAELAAILAEYSPQQQFGQYHVGGWSGVALHAVDGNPLEDQDFPDATYAKTPALELAPTMEQIIDSFPCTKRRVRLLELEPGRKVFWHRDFWHSVDSTQLRVHVPIITNEEVGFQISHQDCPWQAGELWYGDFTFPHRVQNGGDRGRVHLVIDLEVNDKVLALLPQTLMQQRAKRQRARAFCNRSMEVWNHVFATESRLIAEKQRRAN